VAVDLTINFLRAERRMFTAKVRIIEEGGAGALLAQATTTWSLSRGARAASADRA
jgi:hypothetical protein